MRISRTTLAAFVVAAAGLVPASTAGAADGATETIRQLAANGADLVAEEHVLLEMAAPNSPATDLATVRSELRSVDAQGKAVLDQLERLGVEPTAAIRVALDVLPPAEGPPADGAQLRSPPSVVYDAALDDLLRIAANPEAAVPDTDTSGSPKLGLLIVAALSLLTLGGSALLSTFRRRPVTAELAAMAWSDGLTGLANRRRLDHDLLEPGGNGTTNVIMIDVDHFKSVNDSFGHQKGDEVLRTIATTIANQVRYSDVVYRYGGEEFCILLHNSTVEIAELVAERVVRAARQIQLPDGDHITVSVGVADSTHGGVTGAVVSADQALFEAKDRGRDCAVTADRPTVGELTTA